MTPQLFDRFYKGRHALESLYGKTRGFEVQAVAGETPRDPAGLIQQVRSTVTFLEKPKVALPDPDVDGIAVDPPALGRHLGAGADELEGVLGAVEVPAPEAGAGATLPAAPLSAMRRAP